MVSNNKQLLFFIIFTLLFCACRNDDNSSNTDPEEMSIPLSKITLAASSKSFVDANGEAFFPWGFNYTNPVKIGLMEDQWDQEDTWAIIAEDFAEMKSYNANIVRIHLQFHKYMTDPNTPNEVALQRLERVVKIAEDTGLYLDITGLAAYRKSDAPAWYDSLDDNERWAAQTVFWRNIAATVGDSKAVFSYNLMNEPVVALGCDGSTVCEWLPGQGLGGFHFIQNIAKNPELEFSSTIKDWIGELSTAIRSEDENTLITVGFLALGSVTRFEDNLDFLSIHIYPKSGEIQLSVDKVLNNQGTTPLVLEETSNFECNIQELEDFLNQVDGNYDGLMGHYFGETLEDMASRGSVTDELRSNFINFFKANNPN